MKQKFNVEGMSCTSCSGHVDHAVSKLENVFSCSVNLMQNSMIVEYDEHKIDAQMIIKTVQDAGYKASIIQKEKTEEKEDPSKKQKRNVIISFALLIPLMYVSMGPMFSLPMPTLFGGVYDTYFFVCIQVILTLWIMVIHHHYFVNGFKMLWKKTPTMDSLIAIGAGAAFIYSFYLWIQMSIRIISENNPEIHMYAHNLYFESAAMILTLISLGKYLEERAKKRTSDAVHKLMELAADTAVVIRDGKEIEIDTEDVIVGDTLLIKPGQSIPVDGVLVEGFASIDESTISGESVPVDKQENDTIMSGTFNTTTAFTMKATHVKEETTLAKIIQLVEDATASKPNIAKLADKVSGVFVPIVISIALICSIVWLVLGYSFAFSLSIGIAVLVISCPCALGLATPTAIMVGSGKAAQQGILMKRSESLENIHQVDTIVLDKTGTITYGKPQVNSILTKMDENTFIQLGASIEKGSEHPLSTAIIEYAKTKQIETISNHSFTAISGRGAKASIENTVYYAGNKALMVENKIALLEYEEKAKELATSGQIPIYIANEKEVLGIFALRDQVKPTSKEAIQKMQALGLKVYMVTGDNALVAQNIQQELQLDEVKAEVLPQDKETIIASLQKEGHTVLMVGDGINDAPALSRADVGVAIGAGSDIALECADVVLVKNDLLDVLRTITLSHRVIRNIKQNLFWAFFYNIIGIPLAAGILYIPFGFLLNPMFAAAAMSLSSVCVVTNALRLKRIQL